MKKRLLSLALTLALILPLSSALAAEADPVWSNASDWALTELWDAFSFGLIPDCLLETDLTLPITRAEFAAVAVRVYEALSRINAVPAPVNPFTDTSDPEVLKAYSAGITAGTSATAFGPDLSLTREQAATMLTRAYKKAAFADWTPERDMEYPLRYRKPAPFADDGGISDWARECVSFLAAHGIVAGTGDNRFRPGDVLTREQALLIAVRAVKTFRPAELPGTDFAPGYGIVVLYLPDAETGEQRLQALVEELNPDRLMELLVDRGAMPEGSRVLSCRALGDGEVALDINEAAAARFRNLGAGYEHLYLYAMVNTFLCNLEHFTLRLTVEGATLNTGHDVYDYPLRYEAHPNLTNGTDTERILHIPEVVALWGALAGYWVSPDGDYVRFYTTSSMHDPALERGSLVPGDESSLGGIVLKPVSHRGGSYSIGSMRALRAVGEDGDEAVQYNYHIAHIEGLDPRFPDGVKQMKIDDMDWHWQTYTYAGATMEDAMRFYQMTAASFSRAHFSVLFLQSIST